jgi:hypothetical protein
MGHQPRLRNLAILAQPTGGLCTPLLHRRGWISSTTRKNQLLNRGDLFRAGKKIRLLIIFHHIWDSRSSPRKEIRGSSATQRTQGEREDQLVAERSSGLGETWREAYQLMWCRDRPCKQGPHCLEDPTTQKHYSLTTRQLQSLIGLVNGGGTLLSECGIP